MNYRPNMPFIIIYLKDEEHCVEYYGTEQELLDGIIKISNQYPIMSAMEINSCRDIRYPFEKKESVTIHNWTRQEYNNHVPYDSINCEPFMVKIDTYDSTKQNELQIVEWAKEDGFNADIWDGYVRIWKGNSEEIIQEQY